DLLQLGLIDRIPRIIGVQAEGADPIYQAVRSCSARVSFTAAHTIADSISVGAPRNWAKALRAVRESRGDMITVSDQDILDAIPELARETGVFGEPAGVTGFAGFRKMAERGEIARDQRVAFIVTGNGLKDIASAQRAVGEPFVVSPDLKELEILLSGSV
ncbi:MAG: pyridoxal-phosphate dependent enzyme, partial [Synergistales bacterium]|nr:pyridoxal-phosphate dependent enzyme [Synergistales bacterium]